MHLPPRPGDGHPDRATEVQQISPWEHGVLGCAPQVGRAGPSHGVDRQVLVTFPLPGCLVNSARRMRKMRIGTAGAVGGQTHRQYGTCVCSQATAEARCLVRQEFSISEAKEVPVSSLLTSCPRSHWRPPGSIYPLPYPTRLVMRLLYWSGKPHLWSFVSVPAALIMVPALEAMVLSS